MAFTRSPVRSRSGPPAFSPNPCEGCPAVAAQAAKADIELLPTFRSFGQASQREGCKPYGRSTGFIGSVVSITTAARGIPSDASTF